MTDFDSEQEKVCATFFGFSCVAVFIEGVDET